MNYTSIYNSIINNAKNREHVVYSEKHHIVPRCLGGNNKQDNLVKLSYREHFVCHWMLCKLYPDNFKLKAAFAKMLETTKDKKRIVNSKHFDAVKRQLKDVYYPWLEEHMNTHGPWNKGLKGSQVAWNKGLKTGPQTPESNMKRSLSMKEKFSKTEHHLKGVDPWNKGLKGSQVAWNKGLSPIKTPCPCCGLKVSPTNLKRWHGDNCQKKS